MNCDQEIENLRRCLNYDSVTGIFYWSVEIKNGNVIRRRVGDVAGSIDKTKGYRRIRVNKKDYHAHRLAWVFHHGRWPKDQIDHINGDRGDNRIDNLRECNQSQNNANTRLKSNSTSGYKGVYWNKRRKKWSSAISVDGKFKMLGNFEDPKEAHAAYVRAAMLHYGEFARAE